MKTSKRILVVDDEAHIRRILQVAFEKDKFAVEVAEDVPAALESLEQRPIDCVVTDVTMPGQSGYDLLRQINERWPQVPVVIMTAYGTIPQAVQAMRDGAFEYLTKPIDLNVLKKVVASAMESKTGAKPKKSAAGSKEFSLIAESPSMKEVVQLIKQVADSRATVLITGESGVGKEVVAKALHQWSQRAKEPYVAVSCAALPETLLESELFGYEKGAFTGAAGDKKGRFEMAHQGTLFLDEIGEIPASIQVKLLRVLQEREFERLGGQSPVKVDIRLVTATNRNLHQAVEEGIFRLDLLYRLQVVEIEIPPLRDRKEDIVPLANHFLTKFCVENNRKPLQLSLDVKELLENYYWPGNVRELENTMERATVMAEKLDSEIGSKHLPSFLRKAA